VKLSVGQQVWLFWPRPLVRKRKRKLTNLWTGPWIIRKFFSPLVIQIQHSVNHRFQTVHIDRLVPCSNPSTGEEPASEPTRIPLESQIEAASDNGAQSISETLMAPYSLPSITRTGRVVHRPIRYL